MLFFNRIVNPLLPITGESNTKPTEKDVKDFLNLENEPDETTTMFFNDNYQGKNSVGKPPLLLKKYEHCVYKTRILVMIADLEASETELNALSQAARDSANRDAMRYGLVTDKWLIRKLKRTPGWFHSTE